MRPRGPGRDRDAFRRHWERRRPASPNRVVPQLRERQWLPAIYFIFSRAGCERALRRYLEDGDSLLAPERRAEVDERLPTRCGITQYRGRTRSTRSFFAGLRQGAAPADLPALA
jgi:superfamily II RNA helicase